MGPTLFITAVAVEFNNLNPSGSDFVMILFSWPPGAIYSWSSDVAMDGDTTFTDNTAGNDGGQILCMGNAV